MVAGCLITMGTLGDRIGRRRLLLIGAVAFGLASLLCAFSTSAEMLIASRALLGIAGATIAPSTLSLIRNMFHDDAQRTVAIGVWITAFSLGGALGPLFGGVLLEFFWWGSVFLLAVPVMALLLVLGPLVLPEYRDPEAGRLDLVSAALSLVAVLAVVYGLKEFARDGYGVEPMTAVLVGLAVGAVFVRRQTRLAEPLIDLGLFRVRAFSASLAVYTLGILVLFGAFFFIFQYLQLVAGLSPLRAGVVTLPFSAAFIVGAMLAPALVKRVSPADVMSGGLVLATVGFVMLTQVGADSDVFLLIASTVVFSLGLAPLFTLTNDLIIGSAPPERAGAASGISETGAELGGALAIALLAHPRHCCLPESAGRRPPRWSPRRERRSCELDARWCGRRRGRASSEACGRASRGRARRVHRRPAGERARERRHRGRLGCACADSPARCAHGVGASRRLTRARGFPSRKPTRDVRSRVLIREKSSFATSISRLP